MAGVARTVLSDAEPVTLAARVGWTLHYRVEALS